MSFLHFWKLFLKKMFAAEKSIKNKIGLPKKSDLLPIGAADRGRTGTDFTPRDFKSLVSAYSTTAAFQL